MLLLLMSRPGLGPAAEVLSFASPKESTQRKREPKSSSLRFATGTLRCSTFSGACANSLRSNRHTPFIRKSLCCSATLHGASGIGQPRQWLARGGRGDEHLPNAGRSPGVLGRERSDAPSGIWCRYEEAEQRRAGRIRGDACLSEASWRRTPARPRSAGCPQRSGGTTNPARLSFGYFSLAKQRRSTSPAGARPGLPIDQ